MQEQVRHIVVIPAEACFLLHVSEMKKIIFICTGSLLMQVSHSIATAVVSPYFLFSIFHLN
jgi:hypothetical protein